MPKRRKRRAARAQRAEAKKEVRREKQKQQRAKNPPKKRKEQRQQYIEPSPGMSTSQLPTLGTRFAALPAELRAEIFAWLLVRPVKWSATHIATCPLGPAELTQTPFENIRPDWTMQRIFCPSDEHVTTSRWRNHSGWEQVWVDPWRSAWAPAVRNEYVCTVCWDQRHRPKSDPCPHVESLPCLCARQQRSDALASLLVCKSWYEQGARVFYSRNVFAFASPEECIDFFSALNPRWRTFVSKASLLALAPRGEYPISATKELQSVKVNPRALQRAWNLLRKLPALSELELDAIFLTRPDCVPIFRGVALKNLRRINFTQSTPMIPSEAPREFVWPRRALRKTIDYSDFAVDVARGIKGWRHGWVKRQDRGDEQAVVKEQIRYCTRYDAPDQENVRRGRR